jgi:folate-binding Fe-S cluster repair protein YgfZ
MIVEESDVNLLKNAKLYILILMFTFTSKDELYYFLARVSKQYGIKYLQKYYNVIDKFLPIPHA